MIGRAHQDRADHIAAGIRANVRDARIQEVLAQTEEARAALLARRLAGVMRSQTVIGTSLDTLNTASDAVRSSMQQLADAAATSREAILAAAQDALILLEIAAQDARAALEREGHDPSEKPS